MLENIAHEALSNLKEKLSRTNIILGVLLKRHYKDEILSITEEEIDEIENEYSCVSVAFNESNNKLYAKICVMGEEDEEFVEKYSEKKSNTEVMELFLKAMKDFEKSLKALADR